MRRELKCPAPVWKPPVPTGQSWELEITVATPMFGGSDEPREVDAEHPVRAASVRGHLRFWWRATAGAGYEAVPDLWKEEQELWGGPSHPGRVSLDVETLDRGEPRDYASFLPENSANTGPVLGYFLFPFAGDGSKEPAAQGRAGVRVRLRVGVVPAAGTGCEAVREVDAALRAWLWFGGVGSRTRRGCGSLQAAEEWRPTTDAEVREWLDTVSAGERPWPTLSDARIYVGQPQRDASNAWRRLASFWAAFRKGHVGATPYTPMRGGDWKDWDTLAEGRNRDTVPILRLAKPRLGLPIVYQKFEDKKDRRKNQYGPRLEAKLEAGEAAATGARMASPVILKPLVLRSGAWVPLILALQHPPPERVLVDGRGSALEDPTDDPVLIGLGATDPVDAVFRAADRWDWGRDPERNTGAARGTWGGGRR